MIHGYHCLVTDLSPIPNDCNDYCLLQFCISVVPSRLNCFNREIILYFGDTLNYSAVFTTEFNLNLAVLTTEECWKSPVCLRPSQADCGLLKRLIIIYHYGTRLILVSGTVQFTVWHQLQLKCLAFQSNSTFEFPSRKSKISVTSSWSIFS